MLDPRAEITKNAPCSLLYQQTMGRQGYCKRCLDCYSCPVMHVELQKHPLHTQIWVCAPCAGKIAHEAKQQRLGNVLMGYYTEGWCCYPNCGRFSAMLQLILGPLHLVIKEGE
jgi:hypothetical protein